MRLQKITDCETDILELAGLGAGPFNLSLAALLDSQPTISTRFFDKKATFGWHPGLMLPGAHMQTSCLKDLVTAVQPTSPWSFISFLVNKGRFYSFLSTEKMVISRTEFVEYLSWVATNLGSVTFDTEIREVSFTDHHFVLKSDHQSFKARNLCLGTGKSPYTPQCTRRWLGPHCFHAGSLMTQDVDLANKRVAVIGGGQTGAEVFLNCLRGQWGKVTQVNWVSRRAGFEPLDESPFTNEYFTPGYVSQFLSLPSDKKQHIVNYQKLASDGITPAYLLELYRELYDRTYLGNGDVSWQLLPDRTLADMSLTSTGYYDLRLFNALSECDERLGADVVILCTGFQNALPEYLEPIRERLTLDQQNRFKLSPSFKVAWDGPEDRRIYAVNAGLHSHGIVEPQLSLTAWRSATIINDLMNDDVFPVNHPPGFIHWQSNTDFLTNGKGENG
ncbi:lysine N(6)-hydroxylase/L-ornithine N(5)-oxygenase family protein [Endozoicomonas acroporae]|uniref:lysine N(6)-hydroxylase/L-ornithine N(5)-oxygenase family protein n=1 Tax=Endozoicomonas acroporae TaxID=1701104 RepID=UPI000C782124|nr:SidA/IucD/PvdA family monooxygenase [Endozoicomonas acroporae]